MAQDPKPPPRAGAPSTHPPKEGSAGVSHGGASSERALERMRGELSLREVKGLSGQEMLAIALQGFQLYEQGRYDKAKVIFEGLCVLDPTESYYRSALGAVYLAEDDLDMAERLLSAALRLNERELASYVNRGEVYLRQGKILEAARDFKRAVELDPEQKDPISQRARMLATATLETIRAAQRKSGGGAESKAASSPGKSQAASRTGSIPSASSKKK